ncbi:MAG: MazG nucleotide pyrophosphohydrolase domain-containing protein [Pseudomonadota bacterium]|uniref:MazG nucleotide pyrophosphohydrolase domain-containing protein n=1 Tax=Maricaulis sp. TaxID=1486257 RepID=UPI00260C553B|nr:MazG nucleotide pyrophosphohydrolase domain-containing protein [Maricaulis sp.]MED5550147.1 MazG nucleotide pyrophosphohydrolase domain-containing protein [Pseudomonadota bacterium]
MLIARYAKHVQESDQFKERPLEERRRIAIYGLVSEVGSVISAVKKQILGEGGRRDTTEGLLTRHELKEELGDVIWYCFALADLEEGVEDDILAQQLRSLRGRLQGSDARTALFRELLDVKRIEEFCTQAAAFPDKKQRKFRDFQNIAYLTARTNSHELVEVSIAVLTQLSGQLMRHLISDDERLLHDQIRDREIVDLLGEIAWHLAAIASVYELSLDEIVTENVEKAQLRRPTSKPTPLHDGERPKPQQFPRQFEIQFLTVAAGRSRMYMGGRQLGDDLTDNSYDPDGYRFHDALHLANVAHLGWSPVFRSLMKRKRKDDENPLIDEVEDGARAKIIEEAVLKVIHSEGVAIAKIAHSADGTNGIPLFSDDVDIPLSFFKLIRRYVSGLEVEKNSFEEWKASIRDGYKIFQALTEHGQGTVTVHLDKREISFRPEVYVDLVGAVGGIGSFSVSLPDFGSSEQLEARSSLTDAESKRLQASDEVALASHYAAKNAIMQSLGIERASAEQFAALDLTEVQPGKFSADVWSPLRETMWRRGVVAFKTSISRDQSSVYCTALACSDVGSA